MPEEAQTVQVQIKRKLVDPETSPLENYGDPKTIKYSDAVDGVTVDEWHNLPLYDEDGKGPYEYTLEELPNAYYDSEQGTTVSSSIAGVNQVTSNKYTEWKYEKPGFIIARLTSGQFFIWTIDPVSDKKKFFENMAGVPKDQISGGGSSYDKFVSDANASNTVWASGSFDDVATGIKIDVTYLENGDYTAEINFYEGTSIWSQFFYGGYTTTMVPVTNTYNPPTKITVQKNWHDESNTYNTREDIQLVVKRQLYGETEWTVVDDEANPFKIDNEEAGNTFSHEFTLPSKVDGKTATYKVVEMVLNESTGEYEERAVKGYDDPKYSNEDGLAAGTLSVDNDLITYDISVQKIWDDEENDYNTRKDIQLVLQRQLEGETSWSDVGTHDIASGATEDADLSKMFENVPSVVNGLNATYRVIERVTVDGEVQERVPGYKAPAYDPTSISESGNLTVTNELLTTELEFTKVGNDESTPLSGVSFTVTGEENGYKKTLTTGDDGKVLFEDLLELNPDLIPELDSDNPEKDGYYTLTETGLPGYLSAGPWKFSVVYNETSNSMEIVWKDGKSPLKDDKLVNTLKPFELIVNKEDDQDNPLEGAEFALIDANGKQFTATVDGATFTFTGLTAPGEYTLTEVKAPEGYRKLETPIKIVIDELGNVKIDEGEEQAKETLTVSENGNYQITLTVANDPKAPLPSTGGPGTLLFTLIGMATLGAAGIYMFFRKDQEVA